MHDGKAAANKSARVSREFNLFSFLWRFIASLALILASYNPGGVSFYHWLKNGMAAGTVGAEHFVAGVLLLIGWVILLAATQRSLGLLGLLLGGALLGGLVWLSIDLGLLDIDSVSEMSWVVLVCIAALLAIGLSWSHVWRRLTGQFEVDDSDG